MLQLSYISFLIFSVVSFFSPTLKSIFGIIGIVSWLIFLLQRPRAAFNPQLKFLNLVAFLLFITNLITALIYGNNFSILPNHIFGDYIFAICILSLAYNLELKGKLYKGFKYSELLFITITTASLITSLFVLLQVVRVIPSPESGVLGILNQPFTSSGMLLIAVFVTLSLKDYFTDRYSEKKILVSRIFYLFLIIQCSAIVALGQITVWASLAIALIYYFLESQTINLKKIAFALVTILIVITLAQTVSPRIERKLKWFTSFEKLTSNKSVTCRYAIWEQNLNAFKDRPLAGLNTIIPYECVVKKETMRLEHMHNIFLQKLVKGGVFKFALWLTFYLMIFYQLYKAPRAITLPMLCIFIGLFFEGLLENWWDDAEVLHLFFICLAVFLNPASLKVSFSAKATTDKPQDKQ